MICLIQLECAENIVLYRSLLHAMCSLRSMLGGIILPGPLRLFACIYEYKYEHMSTC
jgi:hypothetical protein